MTFKTLALAAAAATMISGAALAQTDTMTTQSTGSALEDPTLMAPFYTDESMTTLRGQDEFTAAFNAMSSDDKERIRSECMNNVSPRATFCESLKNVQ